jgi:hypothetical protein
MSITNLSKDSGRRVRSDASFGPRAAFLATMALNGFLAISGLLPDSLLLPAISSLLLALAIVFALIAWVRCSTDEYGVTYWDVAGALTLVGICTATLIEPDHLVRLVADADSNR